MIEPTTEMRLVFDQAPAADPGCCCPICLNHRLAAVLAVVEPAITANAREAVAVAINDLGRQLGDEGWNELERRATSADYPADLVRSRRRRQDFTTDTIEVAYDIGLRAAAKVARGTPPADPQPLPLSAGRIQSYCGRVERPHDGHVWTTAADHWCPGDEVPGRPEPRFAGNASVTGSARLHLAECLARKLTDDTGTDPLEGGTDRGFPVLDRPCFWCSSPTEACRTHPPECATCGAALLWYEDDPTRQARHWRHVDLVKFYEHGAHRSVPVIDRRGPDSGSQPSKES